MIHFYQDLNSYNQGMNKSYQGKYNLYQVGNDFYRHVNVL